jgi:hypothetical protein
MNKGRKITIGAKFRTAGSTGKKGHVIAREGQWVVFREGADRILYEFDDKKKAILSGKRILKSGKIEVLVLHNADGSVERVQLAK